MKHSDARWEANQPNLTKRRSVTTAFFIFTFIMSHYDLIFSFAKIPDLCQISVIGIFPMRGDRPLGFSCPRLVRTPQLHRMAMVPESLGTKGGSLPTTTATFHHGFANRELRTENREQSSTFQFPPAQNPPSFGPIFRPRVSRESFASY